MRLAKVQDYWRRIYKKIYSVKIKNVSFRNVLGLGEGLINFSGPITIICGANGVGKSTLLNSVFISMEDINRIPSARARARFEHAELNINALQENKEYSFAKNNTALVDADKTFEVEIFDAASKSISLLSFFNSEANIADLDAYSPREYNVNELEDISYAVGKSYTSCLVYEIDDYDSNGGIIPYFRVQSEGIVYGAEMMGLGELAIHLLYWIINRIGNDSVLLLEEPETFVSPRAQIHIMNYLAKRSFEKGIWTIITTHSLGIVSNVPLEHVRLLYRDNNSLQIIDHPTRYQLNSLIGIPFSFSGILMVEDEVAKHLLTSIISNLDQDLLRKFDIVVCGDNSKITDALRKFPVLDRRWLSIIGVYDGDMRSSIEFKTQQWPFVFLPTNVAPEVMFKLYFKNNTVELSDILQKRQSDVDFAFHEADTYDHHDWLKALCEHTQMKEDNMVSVMTTIWLKEQDNKLIAEDFLSQLKGCI